MEFWCNYNFNTRYHFFILFISCLVPVFRYTLNATSMKQERRKKPLIFSRNRWNDQLSGSYTRSRSWFLFPDNKISLLSYIWNFENHKDYTKVIKIRWHFGYYNFIDHNLSSPVGDISLAAFMSNRTVCLHCIMILIMYRLCGVMFR